jgi:metal-responsive CopG/Arc/MetJ family transcriptional regulator
VEVFILKGPARRVRGFVDSLRAIREAYLVEATYADLATPETPHEHG